MHVEQNAQVCYTRDASQTYRCGEHTDYYYILNKKTTTMNQYFKDDNERSTVLTRARNAVKFLLFLIATAMIAVVWFLLIKGKL